MRLIRALTPRPQVNRKPLPSLEEDPEVVGIFSDLLSAVRAAAWAQGERGLLEGDCGGGGKGKWGVGVRGMG